MPYLITIQYKTISLDKSNASTDYTIGYINIESVMLSKSFEYLGKNLLVNKVNSKFILSMKLNF